MAHDRADYRNHCGRCRHFKLDERRTALYRETYGEHIPILGQGWGREPGVWLARVPALPGFGLFGHKW